MWNLTDSVTNSFMWTSGKLLAKFLTRQLKKIHHWVKRTNYVNLKISPKKKKELKDINDVLTSQKKYTSVAYPGKTASVILQ